MRNRMVIRMHALLEKYFPERRVFIRSDSDTRFVRLRPGVQLMAFAGASAIVAWAIIATAILLMDSIGSGNFREQAKRDQRTYEDRLNLLSTERDRRADEAIAAQKRFNSSLSQISVMQSQLLASETRRKELETGIEVIQTTLRRTMKQRDAARHELASAKAIAAGNAAGKGALGPNGKVAEDTVSILSAALAATAGERDKVIADARDALVKADEMALKIKQMEQKNDRIFRQLEDAMTVSVKPLDKMFRAAGMNTKTLLRQVRRGYSGKGGPLTPLSFSTKGTAPSPDTLRANRILNQMDMLNLYRIAASKAPFANPVKAAYRFTSGFGYRRHPITGGRRMHNGVDFAAPHGTPIYSSADGVVIFSGWQSGYGRIIKIQHEFGIETRYAHLSRSRVKVGQKVSRGQRIGDMGNTGRSTGTHLHYEIRVGGKPVNPMIYIKAANNVF